MTAPSCLACLDTGHVCENHSDHPWAPIAGGEECCGGAGMPCPKCCGGDGDEAWEKAAPGMTSIVEAFVPRKDRRGDGTHPALLPPSSWN